MNTGSSSGGSLVTWYRQRIGEPATDDEARGYWLFALGVVLGLIGIVLFLQGPPASQLRQWSIVLAASGFTLLLAGPIIRLPLRPAATWLTYLGVVICAAAIVWFVSAFPEQWSPQTGQPTIISLYVLGVFVMALGGVFIPILTTGQEREAALERELDDARAAQADTEADEADLAGLLESIRSSKAQFELYEDNSDEWRWRLRHWNGQLIADSAEGYTRKHNAQKGLQSVRRNALGAPVLLIAREAELPEPGTEDGFIFPDTVESRASFELFEDDAGETRWRLRHENGNVLADSGEGYTRRRDATTAIEGIKAYVGPADYLRPDPTAFEVYRDQAAEWRWRLVHENGNILADSGQGYSNRTGAVRAIERIRDRVADMSFEVYEDSAGEYRWRLRGGNDQILADSGEGYDSEGAANEAVERMKAYAPDADVLDIGRAAFEVFEDSAGEFRWRLRHRNGQILADSGEGYTERNDVWEAIAGVKKNAPGAETEAVD